MTPRRTPPGDGDSAERERHRQDLRSRLLEAARSGPATPMTGEDRADIRREVRERHARRRDGAEVQGASE